MTCSGGDSAVAADLAAELGVAAARARARDDRAARGDPARRGDRGQPARLHVAAVGRAGASCTALIEALASDPSVGRVLVLYDEAVAGEDWAAVLEAVRDAARTHDVTVASTLPGARGRRRDRRPAQRAAGDAAAPRAAPARAERSDGGRMLGEAETKALLRAAGIDVARRARHRRRRRAPGESSDGPVAVKRIGVTHKARDGGVVLDLDDEASIRAAEQRLGPPTLVERMAPRGIEVLLAIRRDGLVPVLVVGAGGVHTEALDDVAVIPLPAGEDRVAEALRTLRAPIPPEPIARLAALCRTFRSP